MGEAALTTVVYRVRVVAIEDANLVGREYTVNGSMDAGRDPACEVALADPSVSRRHARLEVTPHGLKATDLSSTNGLWFNSRRVPEILMRGGDRFAIGAVVLKVIEERVAAPAPSQAPPVRIEEPPLPAKPVVEPAPPVRVVEPEPLPKPVVEPAPPARVVEPVPPARVMEPAPLPRPVVEPVPPARVVEPAPPARVVEPVPPARVVEPAPLPRPVVEPVPPARVVEPAPPARVVEQAPQVRVERPAPLPKPVVEPAPLARVVEPAPPRDPSSSQCRSFVWRSRPRYRDPSSSQRPRLLRCWNPSPSRLMSRFSLDAWLSRKRSRRHR